MASVGGKAPWTIPKVNSLRAAFEYEIENIGDSLWQQLVTIADGLSNKDNKETAKEEVLDLLRKSAGVEDHGGLSLLSAVDMQVGIHIAKFGRERKSQCRGVEIQHRKEVGLTEVQVSKVSRLPFL